MTCQQKVNYTLKRGETWDRVLTWSVLPLVYKAITGIPSLAPLRLTVPSHDMPPEWLVAISNVGGMRQINAENEPPLDDEYVQATVVDNDTIEINSINAASYNAYTSGGYVRFYTPVDLTGFTARMDIKDKIGGTILHTLSTTLGTIVLDPVNYTISLHIDADDTSGFDWNTAVYSLELADDNDPANVTELLVGRIYMTGEVTTTDTP